MSYSPTMMRWLTQDPLGYVDGMDDYGFVKDNPMTLVDPTGERGITVSVTGPDTWIQTSSLPGHLTDERATVDGSKITGDLNGLLEEVKKTVSASGCCLTKLVFTAHGVDDVDLAPGGKYANYRGIQVVNPGPTKPHGTPLDGEDELGSIGGKLTAAAAFFFAEIAKLACPGEHVAVVLYGCNTGTGKDGADFLQAIANITGGSVKGYTGEVNILGLGTTTGTVTKNPLPPVTTIPAPHAPVGSK